MKEMMGIGPLKLYVIGLSKNKNSISLDQLREVLTETFSFYPLGNIFHVSDIKLVMGNGEFNSSERIVNEIKNGISKIKYDCAVIMGNGQWSRVDALMDIVYSELDSIHLAHELGHILGLDHHYSMCGSWDEEKRVEICPYVGEIMCGYKKSNQPMHFSTDNLAKLESWIK